MNGTLEKPRLQREGSEIPAPRLVLFVCTGNTCRSPMAAALLNDMVRPREVCSLSAGEGEAPRLIAASAGLYAMEGDPITPAAAAALREAGIPPLPQNDYTAHRARTVTEQMMADADEVVAISGNHAMELMMRFPAHASKIVTLGTDIPDPFGGSAEVYRACLMQLRHGIYQRYFGGEAAL